MDLSKLSKFSETKKPESAPQQQTEPTPPLAYRADRQLGVSGAEAWISIALGVILLVVCHRPIEYLFTRHNPAAFSWTFNDSNGNPISYTQSAFFLPDLGVVAFGLVLILDGLLLAFARIRGFVWMTFILTVIVVILNAIAIAVSMNEIGFQILPALAIAFGGYMAVYQWLLLKDSRART
jgi:hypothetical protein